MDKKNILELLLIAIRRVQKVSGEKALEISAQTKPIGDLPGFDSQRGVEATVELESDLDLAIPGEPNLFVSPDGKKALKIGEIAERIYTLIRT